MREERVGVLQKGDEHKPVVDPEVGHKVDTEHGPEPEGHRPDHQGGQPEEYADRRDEDLVSLVGCVEGRICNKI